MIFRMGMTILIVSVTSLYFPLNRKLTGGFNLSTRFDAWIPLWPVWVVPYLLCLPVWIAGLIWAVLKMDEELFRSFASACLFVQVSAMLSFYFFPTYVKRPVLTAGNWATQILQMVYRNDGDYNAFPSGHVYQTALICSITSCIPTTLEFGLVLWSSLRFQPCLRVNITWWIRLVDWRLPGLDTGLDCICFYKNAGPL